MKAFTAAFKDIDAMVEKDGELDEDVEDVLAERRLQRLSEVIREVTCMDLVHEEDPIVRRLALYTLAHRNYLATVPYEIMRDYKVNWGLKKTAKLQEFVDNVDAVVSELYEAE